MALFSWFNSSDQVDTALVVVAVIGSIIELAVAVAAVVNVHKEIEESRKKKLEKYLEIFACLAAFFFLAEAILGWRSSMLLAKDIESLKSENLVHEKQVEELRQKNEAIEAKTRWRTISGEKQMNLVACLNSSPKGKVAICAPFDDQESIMYGVQISNVLSTAGFQVSKYPNDVILAIGAPGLSITCPNLTNAPIYLLSIRNCFNDHDMPLAVKDPTGFTIESNSALIVVGPRF